MNKTEVNIFEARSRAAPLPKKKHFPHLKSIVGDYITGAAPVESLHKLSPRKAAAIRSAKTAEEIAGDTRFNNLILRPSRLNKLE